MITDAAAALQAAFNAEDSTPEVIQAAFDKFGQAIAATVQADFESANGDRNILAQRGFRQLTAPEQKYYEQIIKAGKASNPKQAYEGLLDDKVMPMTVIEDVYKDLVQEHPLLAKINFQSVAYLTRWILNDHTVQTAVWGEINSQITQQITSAFRTVEITQCKLSAYAVIEKDMLDLGPVFLDNYIRTFLKEALATALENAIASGSGHNQPIGLDRDIHQGVSVSSSTGYPQKTAVELTSFMPKEYGAVLAQLAETEVWYTNNTTGAITPASTAANADGSAKSGYTKHGGNVRSFDQVTLICNQKDYLSKIMPATTVLNAAGAFTNNIFPFPTEVIRCNAVATGEAILCLPEEYFFGIGTSKDGTLEFSDEYRFLEDQRVFKIKMHGMGKAWDNTVAILLDISNLEEAYVYIKAADVNVSQG
jgi:hypothetical protein